MSERYETYQDDSIATVKRPLLFDGSNRCSFFDARFMFNNETMCFNISRLHCMLSDRDQNDNNADGNFDRTRQWCRLTAMLILIVSTQKRACILQLKKIDFRSNAPCFRCSGAARRATN